MMCEVAKEIERRYGVEATCPYYRMGQVCDNADDPETRCSWGSPCPYCGHERLWVYDDCVGHNLICLNPECVCDK